MTSAELPPAAAFGPALARASLGIARRFHTGATMWCGAAETPFHARHVAVEFVHPVIVGKRALPAVALPGVDVLSELRSSARPGDVAVLIGPASPAVSRAVQRGPAWGIETVWIGSGPRPPVSPDHLLWFDEATTLDAWEQYVLAYHVLWELTHVCFEHPGLLADPTCDEEVCLTCADEAQLAEVVTVEGADAVVVMAGAVERIDITAVDPPTPGELVLVHGKTAIGNVGDTQ